VGEGHPVTINVASADGASHMPVRRSWAEIRCRPTTVVLLRGDVTALRGDELQTPLQRLVHPGPLALEASGCVRTFGMCLRDETVRNLGTDSGLTGEARTHRSGAAGVWICGCRRSWGTQSESQRQRGGYGKQ
jgi:hypothetical protein